MKLIRLLPAVLVLFGVVLCVSEEESQPMSHRGYLPRSCAESLDRRSGVQKIRPQPGFGEPFEVYCDQEYDGGNWIVIHRRFDGKVSFHRDWDDYEKGFGNLNGEHWLGLKRIHELTYSNEFEVRIQMSLPGGDSAYAHGTLFMVAGPKENYRLESIGDSTGNVSIQGLVLDNMFSTFDVDNDQDFGHCAQRFKSAWWFDTCSTAYDLNGQYRRTWYGGSMRWSSFSIATLATARMLIREVQ